MKLKMLRLTMVLFLLTTLHFSCSSPASSLMSSLGGNANLSSFAGILKSAGGAGDLIGKAPFTMLAPSNEALKGISQEALTNLLKPENKAQLQSILKKHILPGKYTPEQINAGGLKDAAGNALNLGGAKISESIPTKGGMIQVIDKVL
jgi:uncharacterized surface protein with fasciclin (FAS1) repeats